MKLLGAVLIILSGAALGLSGYSSLSLSLRESRQCTLLTERLYTEICLHRYSIPEALREIVCTSTRIGEPTEAWDSFLESLHISAERYAAMAELGLRLRRGDDPERAFSFCRDELNRCTEEAASELRQKGRLYAALGLSGGLLSVILLI